MKKVLILISLIFLITGCSNIKDLTYDEIVQNFGTVSSRTNTYRTGYKYYLPRGMQVNDSTLFNEVLEDGKYTYYLYVDAVSYLNQVSYDYQVDNSILFSTAIKKGDYFGFVEVKLVENNKYLVEIMYNYAKIEVVAYERDIKKVVAYAMSILTSITYNNSVIENYLGDDIFESSEEKYDIFEIVGSDNYLQFTEDIEETDEIRDPDYVN